MIFHDVIHSRYNFSFWVKASYSNATAVAVLRKLESYSGSTPPDYFFNYTLPLANKWYFHTERISVSSYPTILGLVFIGMQAPSGTSPLFSYAVDDISLVRIGLPLPPDPYQNFFGAVNAEMQIVNNVSVGSVPGLIADGGKATRFNSVLPANYTFGHQIEGLYFGKLSGMETRSIEMWFRLTSPMNSGERARHILYSHQGGGIHFYTLFVNAVNRTVEFAIQYDNYYVASLPLSNEMEPHYIAFTMDASGDGSGYFSDVTLYLDGNSSSSLNRSIEGAYCTSLPPSIFLSSTSLISVVLFIVAYLFPTYRLFLEPSIAGEDPKTLEIPLIKNSVTS